MANFQEMARDLVRSMHNIDDVVRSTLLYPERGILGVQEADDFVALSYVDVDTPPGPPVCVYGRESLEALRDAVDRTLNRLAEIERQKLMKDYEEGQEGWSR